MAGFGSGGYGDTLQNLMRQVQQQPVTAGAAPAAPGGGPGEPSQGMNYGQMGSYNTLAQDMSRGYMGQSGLTPGGGFNYSPYGNPYTQPKQQMMQPPPQPQMPFQTHDMGGRYGYTRPQFGGRGGFGRPTFW